MWLANSRTKFPRAAMGLHDVVADGDGQGDFAPASLPNTPKNGAFQLQLERKVLDVFAVQVEHGPHGMDA